MITSVPPREHLFDAWQEGECHEAAQGICSLSLPLSLHFFARPENSLGYCQEIFAAMTVAKELDRIDLPYRKELALEENGGVSRSMYIGNLLAHCEDPKRVSVGYLGFTEEDVENAKKCAQAMLAAARIALVRLFPKENRFSKETVSRYLNFGIGLSKHASESFLPKSDGSGRLSDGHHRACVALRGKFERLWISEK